MNWKLWLEGLAAAALGGFVSGAAQASAAGQLNKGTLVWGGVGAIGGVATYLKTPALPAPPAPPAAQ